MNDVIEQGGVAPIDLTTALEERYLAYALSTITQRALPDVRDGMKPVHRRLLYAMRELNLAPNTPFKKSARVVGDVIGKFHPHGDQAVYEALVRLAQDFAERYPLIEGQGNFGNVDGDGAAAMRYTEARLTEVAMLLLEGIDEDAVDFRPTYDASEDEPNVLPGGFPNLLANGAMGIAVGMATSIPPHNICELLQAALYILDNPKATTDDILPFVKGPDFPTGGVIIDEPSVIAEAYRTGRGQVRVRAFWQIEKGDRGAEVAVITQIPFMVQKGRLIERIAGLMDERKLPMILDVRDESSDDIRVVVEPRTRAVDLTLMMEGLFKATELENRFSLNMNVLVGGLVPQVLGLADHLRYWLNHLRDVTRRRAGFRLEAVDKRLNILGGLLIVYLDLDRVIRIIREEDEPKAALILAFALNEVQAEAILNTRLRSLRKLEEMALKNEQTQLLAEKETLEKLLGSEGVQWRKVRAQVQALSQKFTPETALGKRRTTFAAAPDLKQALEDVLVEREPMSIVFSQKGWVRSLKGHTTDTSGLTFKAEDELSGLLCVQSTDKVLVFASDGKVFTLEAGKLPSGRGFGDPLRLHVDLDEMAHVVGFYVYTGAEQRFLLSTQEGRGFVVKADEALATTRRGKQVMNVTGKAILSHVLPVVGESVACMGDNRKLVVFPLSEVPELGRGQGVRLQRYKDGGLKDICTFRFEDGLGIFDASGQEKRIADLALWLGHRADAGKLAPRQIKSLKRS